MKLTIEKAKAMMDKNGGWLDLSGTPITALPDNLTVGGSLYLEDTPETMRRVNLANAKRRIIQLADANFTEADLHLTLTYENPPSYTRCQKDVQNFIKAVKRRREKRGLPEVKYIYVIEDNEDGVKKRIHVHMLISGGLEREALEQLWARGYANCDRLKPNERGLEELARYLVKSQKHRRKWCCSKNLKKPQVRVSDCKLSNSKVKRIARDLPNEAKEILRKAYPGYEYVECRVKFSDQVDGCYIRALMRQTDGGEKRGRQGQGGMAGKHPAG